MTAIFKNAKYVLALMALGVLLAGCDRNGGDAGPAANSGSPAAPAPDTATPPAASPTPEPAPAPDTSSTMPPPADSGSSSAGSTASGMASAAGDAVEDTVITTKVKAALLADTDVKGTDIEVETVKGDVTLSGSVSSQAQIDKALGIARAIEGVKNVDNKLTVKAG